MDVIAQELTVVALHDRLAGGFSGSGIGSSCDTSKSSHGMSS